MSELSEGLDKQAIEDMLFLTPMQASMLNTYLEDLESDNYLTQLSLNISGKIDIDFFKKAWDFVVTNNEMLRTLLPHEKMKKFTQVVLKKSPVEIRHLNFTDRLDDARLAVENIRNTDRQEKFYPLQVPFRVTLCKLTQDSHELIVSHHPVLFDSRSRSIILQEFFAAYHRLSSGMELTKTTKTKFKEYTKWIYSKDEIRQKRYWKNYLLDLKTGTEISVKRGKGKGSRTFRNFYKKLEKDLHLKLTDFIKDNKTKGSQSASQKTDPFYGLGEIYQTHSSVTPGDGLSLSTLFYTAFGILLQRYNNSKDVIFGTAVSGRTAKVDGTENAVGFFGNILPLRIHGESGDKTADLIEKVNKAQQKRVEYETVSLDQIKKYSRFDKSEGLFDTLLQIEHNPINIDQVQGDGPLTIHSYSTFETPAYDLTIVLTLSDDISFKIIFNNECFEEETIARLASHFIKILEDITENTVKALSEIEMLSLSERKQLVDDFNRRESDFLTQRTVPQLFSDQVEKTPDHTAIVYEEEEISYRDLDSRSNVMAHFLLEQGVGRCDMVGIMVERSLELIVGILGILKTGGAYVPLNGKAPLIRNRFIMDECNVKILLTGSNIREQTKVEGEIEYFEIQSTMLEDVSMIAGLPEKQRAAGAGSVPTESRAKGEFSSTSLTVESSTYHPEYSANAQPVDLSDFQSLNSPEDPAYVIFTSGSTGNPKGIAVTHANLSPLLHWGYQTLSIGTGDRTLQNLSVYFDWSVWEIFITLTTGAALYIAPNEVLRNSTTCINFMTSNNITAFHVTPTQYRYIAAKGQKLPTLKYLFLGAEKLTYNLLERSLTSVSETCRVFNMYGPTEATIISAVLEIDKEEYTKYRKLSSIPIGKPVANLRLFVLDKDLHLCPVGVAGELYIAGDGVAAGYLNEKGLTEESFIGNPFEKQVVGRRPPVMYKTGDLVRWLSDGNIEFLGRLDYQIKIRGFRIEPGEIENQLLKHEDIRETVVTDVVTAEGEKYLCAYIVTQGAGPRDSNTPDEGTHKRLIASRLREFLAQTLPDYMIPARYVFLDSFPLNPSGKVDRKALPTPE